MSSLGAIVEMTTGAKGSSTAVRRIVEVTLAPRGETTSAAAGPDGPGGQFPARLGRRLGLTIAGIVAVFLLVGGLSIVLTRNVARLHHLVDQERLHIQLVDDIRASFGRLLFEFQQMQLTGSRPMRDASVLHAELVESLKSVRDLHTQEEGIPEDGQARAAFTSLWESASALRPMAESLANEPSLGPRLNSRELERLSFVAYQVPDKTTILGQAHEARVTHLLDASEKVQQAILILYFVTFCLGGLLVVVAGRVFHARIAAPLRSLVGAARGMAEGNFQRRVAVASHDEIGQLSHVFNVMAEGLETRERDLRSAQAHLERKLRELEVLNQIGSEMLAFTGPDTILQSIVDKAREILRVDAAAVCLTAADSGELTISATSGPADAFLDESDSAARSAARRGGTVHSLDECPVMDSEYIRTHVDVPLKRGRASIGALCVGSREERNFSDEERGLLFSLAAQAAITVEHARLDAQVRELAVSEERGRIARDMHDGLAQSVSLLHLKVRQAQALFAAGKSSLAADTLAELADISASAYDDVRQSIFGLRTMVSGGLGFVPTLAELLHEFSERHNLPIKLETDGTEHIRLPPASEVQLIRFVQEALTNVRKHAQARHVRVFAKRQDGQLHVSVEDDGRGFDPAKLAAPNGLHFGLQGMRERVEGLGGMLEIVTAPDHGTRVRAILPMERVS